MQLGRMATVLLLDMLPEHVLIVNTAAAMWTKNPGSLRMHLLYVKSYSVLVLEFFVAQRTVGAFGLLGMLFADVLAEALLV